MIRFRTHALRSVAAFAAGAAGIFLAAGSASADPHTEYLDGVIDEIEHRIADDFSGELDKTQKKQLKALEKALAAFAKPADDLGDDLKAAGKAQKGLAKAFPDDFQQIGSHNGNFRNLFDGAFDDLQSEILDLLDTQDGRIPSLTEKAAAKVAAILEAAGEDLDSVDTADQPAWVKELLAAYKAALKADKTADKDIEKRKNTFTFTYGGKTYNVNPIAAAYDEIIGTTVVGGASGAGLGARAISVAPDTLIEGPGTYGISVASITITQLPPQNFIASSGTFTVTTLDTVADRIAGTFSFTATDLVGAGGSINVTGAFDTCYNCTQ